MNKRYSELRSYGHTRMTAFLSCVPIGPFLLASAFVGFIVGWFVL